MDSSELSDAFSPSDSSSAETSPNVIIRSPSQVSVRRHDTEDQEHTIELIITNAEVTMNHAEADDNASNTTKEGRHRSKSVSKTASSCESEGYSDDSDSQSSEDDDVPSEEKSEERKLSHKRAQSNAKLITDEAVAPVTPPELNLVEVQVVSPPSDRTPRSRTVEDVRMKRDSPGKRKLSAGSALLASIASRSRSASNGTQQTEKARKKSVAKVESEVILMRKASSIRRDLKSSTSEVDRPRPTFRRSIDPVLHRSSTTSTGSEIPDEGKKTKCTCIVS
ncbi:nucleocytoplasmic transport chaperone Srp40 (predicted) [Planoprotostelium fungivorum]|uniref:Nucleocytoplasmic transport chaperone Srp40 (Predicted) n=1 Tax=Planoprotostelium fungivorum TaxID=1890364 RepID=A0A2P6NN22_9EUKA|nr:nucleocytoplasmic transport chaperone Srp40 (predicted) [Planoprotostelium fungivorum]